MKGIQYIMSLLLRTLTLKVPKPKSDNVLNRDIASVCKKAKKSLKNSQKSVLSFKR